jgi:hypothetical protein
MNRFEVRLRKRNISEEELLSDLRRVADFVQSPTLTAIEYAERGEFGVNTFLRRFGKWNVALQAAGLEAPNRQHVSDAELFENLAQVWTAIGRQPVGKDLDKSNGTSEFSLGTYEKRFRSWNGALMAFQLYINNDVPIELESASKLRIGTSSKKRTSRKINWRLRAQVLIRDNCICRMCGASPAKDPMVELHADHIQPWSKGGETVLENLQTLCLVCNIGKSDLDDER